MNEQHSKFGTFSHPCSTILRIVFPITIQPMGDHINFFQDVPRDLQCLPMSLAICVVEDISKRLDILTLEFWPIWWYPPILPEYRQILYHLLVRHNLVILQQHPLFLQHLGRTRALFSKNCIGSRVVFYNVPPNTTLPLYLCNLGSNSAFLRWHMSISVAKWTFFLSLCASRKTCFILLTFSKFHAGFV